MLFFWGEIFTFEKTDFNGGLLVVFFSFWEVKELYPYAYDIRGPNFLGFRFATVWPPPKGVTKKAAITPNDGD